MSASPPGPVPAPPSPTAASVTGDVVGRRTVLSVSGEIDLDSVSVLAEAVDAALGSGALEVWIDLSHTDFMDSSGLHLLLDTQRRVRALNRRLAVICARGCVRRLIEVAGVADRVALHHHRAAAHLAA